MKTDYLNEEFWQVRIKVKKELSVPFQDFFMQSGALGFFELLYQEGVTQNLSQEDTWLFFVFEKSFPACAFSQMAYSLLTHEKDTNQEMDCRLVMYHDYIEIFKKTFHAFLLGKKTWLVPPWETPKIEQGLRSFILKPGMAFGTGKHATSQLMTTYIEEHIQAGDVVFDLGCGSGILSIVASLWGAQKTVGVDVENLSVQSARENASFNKDMSQVCSFEVGDFSFYENENFPKQMNVFLSNILASVFYANQKHLQFYLNHTNKWALSGITSNQKKEFESFLNQLGIKEFSTQEKDGWVMYCHA